MGGVAKVIGGIAGAIGGFIVGGPVGAVIGAGIGASSKPLVKIEKTIVGAATGFVSSGFNPVGALVGGGISAVSGGQIIGQTNIGLPALAGGAIGVLAPYGTTVTTINGVRTVASGPFGGPLFANPIASALAKSPLSTMGMINTGQSTIVSAITPGESASTPQTQDYSIMPTPRAGVVYTPMGNTTFSGNLFSPGGYSGYGGVKV